MTFHPTFYNSLRSCKIKGVKSVAERPCYLMVGPLSNQKEGLNTPSLSTGEWMHIGSMEEALTILDQKKINGLFLDLSVPDQEAELKPFLQGKLILDSLGDGVALVEAFSDPGNTSYPSNGFRIRWANQTFSSWCGHSVLGEDFYEGLGIHHDRASMECPLVRAWQRFLANPKDTTPSSGRLVVESPASATLLNQAAEGGRHLDIEVARLRGSEPLQLIVQAQDMTAVVRQQNKLALLHQAGRELANLAPDLLAEMSVAERIDLLKRNIHRIIRDFLKVDLIEIRLLNPQTGLLTPLLIEGMGPEAQERPLRVALEGQGVTGYVAATGRSYLCTDTARDPLYITGAPDARSSVTVPLKYQERIIGTLNLESPRPNAFTQEDLGDAELLSRDVADALHTLELLTAEKHSTATQSIEAVNREVALPVDDILANTTCILDQYIGPDPQMATALRKILASARQIKQTIQKVGEEMAPPGMPLPRPFSPGICEPSNPAIAQLKGLRVLVADNDDRVRRSAHSLLGRWGCIVETARDGREALTMARLETYNIILADIRLPDIHGYQIYRSLRETQPEARVVLMTGFGYDPHHSLVQARQDGLRFVLFKPFRVDQLLDALTSPPTGNAPESGSPGPTV